MANATSEGMCPVEGAGAPSGVQMSVVKVVCEREECANEGERESTWEDGSASTYHSQSPVENAKSQTLNPQPCAPWTPP